MIDYLHPPKDPQENLLWRVQLNQSVADNPNLAALIIEYCARNIEYYFDGFCWTYDPREVKPHKPFILWPRQREFLCWFEDKYQLSQRGEKINIGVDKPRGVGVSYLILGWMDHHFKFHDFSARIGSRKEDFVDKKGDMDALFPKIDYQNERQPSWFLDAIGAMTRSHMLLKFADTSKTNSIVGESANPDFGRGGRKNAALFDEFGFWDWARSSWESSGESTNFRIAVSTPPEAGHDSHFWKLLNNKAGKVYIFPFNWDDVPGRDQKWLAQSRATKSEEEFAREVMKSFEGTTVGKVYAQSFRQVIISDVQYNPLLPLFVSWDFGLDSVAMIWWQKDFATNKVYMIDSYTNLNKEIDFYVPFVKGVVKSGQHEYTNYELEMIDRHKLWNKTVTHFGDPDVRKRNLINKESVKDHLYTTEGIYVQSMPWGGREWGDLKAKTFLLFRRLEINEKRCEPVLSAMRNAKYPEIREGSNRTAEPVKPIHDWTSHFRTSFEYFADNEPFANEVRTVLSSTGPVQPRIKLPHEIEAERERSRELISKAKTILKNVNNQNTPNRIL